MSKQGRTIIFSIHQPRYSIFKLFDSLTLLASGRLMFHGPAQQALDYFQSFGMVDFFVLLRSFIDSILKENKGVTWSAVWSLSRYTYITVSTALKHLRLVWCLNFSLLCSASLLFMTLFCPVWVHAHAHAHVCFVCVCVCISNGAISLVLSSGDFSLTVQ